LPTTFPIVKQFNLKLCHEKKDLHHLYKDLYASRFFLDAGCTDTAAPPDG